MAAGVTTALASLSRQRLRLQWMYRSSLWSNGSQRACIEVRFAGNTAPSSSRPHVSLAFVSWRASGGERCANNGCSAGELGDNPQKTHDKLGGKERKKIISMRWCGSPFRGSGGVGAAGISSRTGI